MTSGSPGGTSTRNVQRGPSDAIAQAFSALASPNTTRPVASTAGGAGPLQRAFDAHRHEAEGIRPSHHAIDVVGRLDGAAAPQQRGVVRRERRFARQDEQHGERRERGDAHRWRRI